SSAVTAMDLFWCGRQVSPAVLPVIATVQLPWSGLAVARGEYQVVVPPVGWSSLKLAAPIATLVENHFDQFVSTSMIPLSETSLSEAHSPLSDSTLPQLR